MTSTPKNGGIELIVYQISQLEKAISAMSLNFDSFRERIEIRIQSLESFRIEVDSQKALVVLRQNDDWIKNFKDRWKLIVTLVGVLGAVLGFTLTLLANYLKLMGK